MPGSASDPLSIAYLIEHFDWSSTPLGTRASWPVSLRTAVDLLRLSPVPIVSLWYEEGIMIYNDAYSEFAGGRHPKLFGSPVRDGWPEVADFNDNVMKVGLAGGTLSYRDHVLILNRTGTPEDVWLNLDYSPVIGEQGEPIGVIAIVVEITNAVRATRNLQESEARFRALTNASSSVVYQISADWKEMRQLDGRGFLLSTDAPSVAWLDAYIYPEDQQYILSVIEDAKRTKSVYELEHRVRRADGTPGWTFSRAVPIISSDGEIVEWFGSASDVTDRRETESRLKFLDALGVEASQVSSADKILAITTRMIGEYLDVTSCAYADMDADEDGFTIRGDWAAPGAQHIVGHYSLAGFGQLAVNRLTAGQPLIICDNLKELPPHEAAAFQSLGISATICMPLVKEGKLTALMAIHHQKPHVWLQHEVAVIKEVTERSWAHVERVRSEAEVREGERRFREELEQQVADRTRDVKKAEEALQQSRKLEAIGNLTGGIAHDFNNLLSPIMGSLELLRRRVPQDPQLLKFIDHALDGAKRGASLISRMLAFARKHEMSVEATDVGALVDGMTELLNRSLGAAQVHVSLEPCLPKVEADPNQLEAALLNLVLNARDAMDGQGEIKIAAKCMFIDAGNPALTAGDYVCLSVTDSGHGMDAETLAKASEPFFTTKGVGKGTGLGVPMVQGFAEQLGGKLVLKSAPGQGTRAEILLPVAREGLQQPASQASPEVAVAPRTLSILVVDDDPLILMNAVDMLEELGQTVSQASSGIEALELLQAQSFDLVITDHAMPQMTGAELIEKIKLAYPQMPIILATGYAELPATTGLQFVRLPKPYTLDELAAALAAQSVPSAALAQ